jgi:hypothetical protein
MTNVMTGGPGPSRAGAAVPSLVAPGGYPP